MRHFNWDTPYHDSETLFLNMRAESLQNLEYSARNWRMLSKCKQVLSNYGGVESQGTRLQRYKAFQM